MTTTPSSLSVVIPVYNEEDNVPHLAKKLHDAFPPWGRGYEVLLIDDGSRDASWDRLVEAARAYPRFRLIRFRRNFGQTAAMSAGIDAARNDVIITLDADLQNDPADIPRLLHEMEQNGCRRGLRLAQGPPGSFLNRRLPSCSPTPSFRRSPASASTTTAAPSKAYRRDVLQGVRLYGEMHRSHSRALLVGRQRHLRGGRLPHYPRVAGLGNPKYGIGRTFRVILDLFTVKFLLRFTGGPMQLFGKIAFLFGGAGA